jgi:hypothetical protein
MRKSVLRADGMTYKWIQGKSGGIMRTTIMAAALVFLIGLSGSRVMAGDSLVRFEGGIGVLPVSSSAGLMNEDGTFPNVNRNDVQGVPPAGQPWVIEKFTARVRADGSISAKGEGLLLAGGNGIGTNANASVFVTLFCNGMAHSTNLAGVPLEPNGDFRIEDFLTPTPPNPCTSPVLLVRTANGGRWFAAGISEKPDL